MKVKFSFDFQLNCVNMAQGENKMSKNFKMKGHSS